MRGSSRPRPACWPSRCSATARRTTSRALGRHLVRGDWSATPVSHPETLGFDLEGSSTSADPAVEISQDFPFARQLYDQATASFTFAGAARGLAAVELRRAYLDSVEGDREAARQRLNAVVELASQNGDGACANLARVHLAILAIGDEVPIDPEAIGGDIASWATGDGSYSYARGLARLCLAAARRWREQGEFARGRAALRISDAINVGVGAVQEPALVGAELGELYGGANYRRALLVLTELDLDREIAGLTAGQAMQWMGLVDRAMRAMGAAMALRDSEAIARSRERMQRLKEVGGTIAPEAESMELMMVGTFTGVLDELIAQCEVLASLYHGTAAPILGFPEEADKRFADALKSAKRVEPEGGLMTTAVLVTMNRRDDAHAMIERLILGRRRAARHGHPAAHEGRGGRRGEAGAREARRDGCAARTCGPARRVGDARRGRGGERRVGGRQDDRGRRDCRIRESGRPALAGRPADLDVGQPRCRESVHVGDPGQPGARGRRRDRGRVPALGIVAAGSPLADLLAGDAAAGAAPPVVAAMRRWLRAGTQLAQTFEEISGGPSTAALAQSPGDGAAVRLRIAGVERELDDAEVALGRAGGGALTSRGQSPPTPDLAEIQSLLGADTVLLQYHLFDDELFIWAVTADRAEVVRAAAVTSTLSGDARRFHRLCGDGMSTDGQRAELGGALAEHLLKPVATWLSDHPRVVVVPHAGLSLLPFHLLPFDSDVLGAGRALSYLPAASVAPRWRDRPPVRLDRDALVVGDPTYGPARNSRQLPSARLEAAVVAAVLGAEPLLAEAATQDAVLAGLPGAHVLHLATHGRALDGAPNSAELALAGDGKLTIADLMGSDTDIDLAVLSACDTGRGTATASGDVVGLTRALLGAGARDIVVSLWPVDDQTACLTMVRFYEQLKAGSGVSAALADAQADVRRRSPAERDTWYESLAAHDDAAETAAAGTRGWSPGDSATSPPADPNHPALWGPFVHVGL